MTYEVILVFWANWPESSQCFTFDDYDEAVHFSNYAFMADEVKEFRIIDEYDVEMYYREKKPFGTP